MANGTIIRPKMNPMMTRIFHRLVYFLNPTSGSTVLFEMEISSGETQSFAIFKFRRRANRIFCSIDISFPLGAGQVILSQSDTESLLSAICKFKQELTLFANHPEDNGATGAPFSSYSNRPNRPDLEFAIQKKQFAFGLSVKMHETEISYILKIASLEFLGSSPIGREQLYSFLDKSYRMQNVLRLLRNEET